MKYIQKFLNSDSAVSFGLLALAAFLIGATAIWIEFSPIFNMFFAAYNVNIAAGEVTLQNQKAMEFHQNMISIGAVIALLIGAVAWGYVRALEKRNDL